MFFSSPSRYHSSCLMPLWQWLSTFKEFTRNDELIPLIAQQNQVLNSCECRGFILACNQMSVNHDMNTVRFAGYKACPTIAHCVFRYDCQPRKVWQSSKFKHWWLERKKEKINNVTHGYLYVHLLLLQRLSKSKFPENEWLNQWAKKRKLMLVHLVY